MSESAESWLNDQQPFDEAVSRVQVAGLLELLGAAPKRVLDLGCGVGRVLVPLAEAGHDVVGIDRDAAFLETCRTALRDLGLAASLRKADLFQEWPADLGFFDAVLCLGNTFMMLWDVEAAVLFLRDAATHLRPGGAMVLDDLPHQYWPELIEGNWLAGISEDETSQLVWASHDSVFAIRHGDEVDPKSWSIRESDTPMRLWTSGDLRLAGLLAGLSGPHCQAESNLLVMPLAAKRTDA